MPFIGTVGYSVLYNVPKRYFSQLWIYRNYGVVGVSFSKNATPLSSAVASFFAALVVVLISRLLTVRMKCPRSRFFLYPAFSACSGSKGLLYRILSCDK